MPSMGSTDAIGSSPPTSLPTLVWNPDKKGTPSVTDTCCLGFLVIYAKFSDVLGRKVTVLTAMATFTIASIACGFASTMDQL
jgi:MFS family permease